MLEEDELKGVPLLVFANKQDLPSAEKPDSVSDLLGLAGKEKGRPWSVRGSCATENDGEKNGLEQGLDWSVHPNRISCSKLTMIIGWSMPFKANNGLNHQT